MYFGPNLAFGYEGIPICERQFRELKKSVEDWRQVCLNSRGHELKTSQCQAEKEYNQKRMKVYKKTCFYDGNFFY